MNKTDRKIWNALIVALDFAAAAIFVVAAALNLVAVGRTDIATIQILAAILFAANAIIFLHRILRQKN